jgi:hypothetical protein
MVNENIGIAYLDGTGRELGSDNGHQNVDMARQVAETGLRVRTYATAVRVTIYKGRSLAEGEVLEEVLP